MPRFVHVFLPHTLDSRSAAQGSPSGSSTRVAGSGEPLRHSWAAPATTSASSSDISSPRQSQSLKEGVVLDTGAHLDTQMHACIYVCTLKEVHLHLLCVYVYV